MRRVGVRPWTATVVARDPRVLRQRLPEHRAAVPDHAGRLAGVRARAPAARHARRSVRPARLLRLAGRARRAHVLGRRRVDDHRGRRRGADRARLAARAAAHRAARGVYVVWFACDRARRLRRLPRRARVESSRFVRTFVAATFGAIGHYRGHRARARRAARRRARRRVAAAAGGGAAVTRGRDPGRRCSSARFSLLCITGYGRAGLSSFRREEPLPPPRRRDDPARARRSPPTRSMRRVARAHDRRRRRAR